MKRRNATRKALVASVVSLLLCVSMLVGTTFAWFTDEVESGLNTIAAGNLDIEMYHSNAKVTAEETVAAATDLFLDVNGNEILWEPGVVSYENIKIANVGSLALQYRLSLNIANENNLNGHGLSEVLKVVLLDETIAAGATRAEVMAKATAALADPEYTLDGKLSQMVEQGKLYPEGSNEGDSSITGALVVFWEPNDNETDNLYNANNGQKTSDEQPLHIDFGVRLEATQLMYENDSFGPDYDKFTGFTPMPSVDSADTGITYTEGIGGEVKTTNLDTAYQFRPTETYEQGQQSEYFNYIVDFVVSADRYVPADSILLAGYYDAWCQYNNDNWVGLIGGDVAAGNEIRLVNDGLGAGYNVQYKHLLEYGNDGIGFLCGAKDLTGENTGTTLTVKLNLYATKLDENGHYVETGEVITVGTFTYTFKNEVSTAAELKEQLAAGNDVTLANDIIVDVAETGFVVAKDASAKIDLNGHDIIATSTSAANTQLFSVSGNLEIVGNGTISLNNDNFAWDTSARYTAINIRETGVVTLGEGVKVVCEGGSATADGYGMTYAVDIYTTGTLNVNGASLHSNYIAVRCFFGNSVVYVGSGSSITSSRNNYGIWPQSAPGAVINIDSSVTHTVDSNGIYIFG